MLRRLINSHLLKQTIKGKPKATPVAAVEKGANRTSECDGKWGPFVKRNVVNGITFKELAPVPYFIVL